MPHSPAQNHYGTHPHSPVPTTDAEWGSSSIFTRQGAPRRSRRTRRRELLKFKFGCDIFSSGSLVTPPLPSSTVTMTLTEPASVYHTPQGGREGQGESLIDEASFKASPGDTLRSFVREISQQVRVWRRIVSHGAAGRALPRSSLCRWIVLSLDRHSLSRHCSRPPGARSPSLPPSPPPRWSRTVRSACSSSSRTG